jgi:hypothetical protein
MRKLVTLFTMAVLTVPVSAQELDSLLAEATQPVTVEIAIGLSLTNPAGTALADAGLAAAVPSRVSVSSLSNPDALSARAAAEDSLSGRGPSIISDLITAELDSPVGLWLGAGAEGAPNALVSGQIRGLNIERVLTGMGPPALSELESIADTGEGPVADRAQSLHHELSQLDVTILPNGTVRVEGKTTDVDDLADAVAAHELAQTGLVTAPGDLPINLAIPVLDALRAAGLDAVELRATEGAVVTINDTAG